MSCIQFFTASAVCLVPTLLWEQPTLAALLAAWAPILYAGVLSSGVAYTLQVIGQRDTDPTVASLILSLESTRDLVLRAGCSWESGCRRVSSWAVRWRLPRSSWPSCPNAAWPHGQGIEARPAFTAGGSHA